MTPCHHYQVGKRLKEEHRLQLTNLQDQLTVLKKRRTKFDCLNYEMLFMRARLFESRLALIQD